MSRYFTTYQTGHPAVRTSHNHIWVDITDSKYAHWFEHSDITFESGLRSGRSCDNAPFKYMPRSLATEYKNQLAATWAVS